MRFKIFLVSTTQRLKWIKSKYKLEETIFIGDGLLDYLVMEKLVIQSPPTIQVILQKNIVIMYLEDQVEIER